MQNNAKLYAIMKVNTNTLPGGRQAYLNIYVPFTPNAQATRSIVKIAFQDQILLWQDVHLIYIYKKTTSVHYL